MNIAIVGSGLIGQAWAIVFARAGLSVKMWDGDATALAKAHQIVSQQLKALQAQQLVQDADLALSHISTVTSLEDALENTDYVQENLPERVDLKLEIYAKMDTLAAPETILASSTSSIPASAFTESLSGRHRCLVAHPVNPPYLIPVVEICGAPWTTKTAVEQTRALMHRIGQKPVTVNQEVEGFVLNRLQGALLREAFRLVESGTVSAEDLDATIKDGLGLRWAFMGPFETIDLNAPAGLADYCARYGSMYERMFAERGDTAPWSAELIESIEAQRRALLPAKELAQRRQWRDERLMALLRHKQANAASDNQQSDQTKIAKD